MTFNIYYKKAERATDGSRTRDLRTTNAVLYLLSYGSKLYNNTILIIKC